MCKLPVDLAYTFDRLPSKEIWEALGNPIYMTELSSTIKSLSSNCVSALKTQVREDKGFDVREGVSRTSRAIRLRQ